MKIHFDSNLKKKCLSFITLFFFLFSQSAFAAVTLTNGNFGDVTGMVDIGGGWYDGVPNGWSATGTNQYVINNNVLNLDHVATFSQTLGMVEAGAEDVTVSFEYGDIWNGGYYAPGENMITVELVNITTPATITKVVKNDAAFGSMTPDSISITATANDVLEIRFTSLVGTGVTPGKAAAIDNVSVIETTLPILNTISSDTADGTYTLADVIDMDLTFSESVSSTGLILNLEGGGTCTIAAFSNSNTATCDYTVGASENSSDLTVTSIVGTITDAAMNATVNPVPVSNLAAAKDIVIYNAVPPVLTEVTPVTTPTYDTTPSYTFSSSEAGDITYGGDCVSTIDVTNLAGNNTVTFDTLSLGVHSNCTITVTDIDGMATVLNVSSFKIIPTPNTVIVNSINPWPQIGYVETTGTGAGSYASAPNPPLGSGALQMTISGPTGSYYTSTPLHNNTPLSDITKLSYSTYRSSVDAGNNLAIALQLNVDYDATDASSAWQGRLVFEPYNKPGMGGTIVQNTWQNWDTLTGVWWMSGNAMVAGVNVGKACTQAAPCTWDAVKAAYPNAIISSALGFKAGSNWTDFSGFVDNFNIALDSTGADTTYNFESDATAPIISNVTTEILYPAGLSIRWTTDEPTTSQIKYGLTNAYGTTTPLDSVLKTDHVINLSGLDSPAQYYFEIVATDIAGNTANANTSGTAATSGGGSGGVSVSGSNTFQAPTTPTQPTTPDNNSNPAAPDNTTPETPTPEVTPIPETPTDETTPENTETPNPTTPTQPTTPTGNTTGGTGGTTGGNAGPGFNPADATLDIGGAGTPEETTVEEAAPTPADATLDAGGGVGVEDSSYTFLWTLLALIALLNVWWFFVAKNKGQPAHRRD